MLPDERVATDAEAPVRTDVEDPHITVPEDPVAVAPGAPAVSHRVEQAHRRSLRRWAIASGIGVALVTGSVSLSYTSLFGARSIRVTGEERIGPRRVLKIAGIGEDTNLVHLDERAAEARLKGEPWILDATVMVDLPSTIRVRILERTPVLVLAEGGSRTLVSADGVVLGAAPRGTAFPEMVVEPGSEPGVSGLRSAADAVASMAPSLRARVASVGISDDGELSMVVDGGVEVRYGSSGDTAAKAQALQAILSFAGREDKVLLAIDVSAPGAPTARFVGSYQPATGPDPSADVPPPSESRRGARGTISSSASASPSP
ncbi:MAG: cell division protein FtsQ/DivIB [Actinomycetota bacterium]